MGCLPTAAQPTNFAALPEGHPANWHLLPFEQIIALLGWSNDKPNSRLRKMTSLVSSSARNQCERVLYYEPTDRAETAGKCARSKLLGKT
jgi:hypothetical protein